MPRKTLDELFQPGPPRRADDDSREEMNDEEQKYVLWGLKEDWDISRIAEALAVEERIVSQFYVGLVKNPDVLLDLDIIEPIEDQGVTMFRCVVCTVHLNSPDQIDRHVLAHFLKDADLDAAIEARSKSERQHVPPEVTDNEQPGQPEAEAGGIPDSPAVESAETGEQEGGEDAAPSVIPPDADRAEILQALRRLAALPDDPVSMKEPPVQDEAADADDPKVEPQPATSEEEQKDEIDNSFERLAVLVESTEEPTEAVPEQAETIQVEPETERIAESVASTEVPDAVPDEVALVRRPRETTNGSRLMVHDPPRKGLARVLHFFTGWARSANAERQRRDVVGGMGSVKEATSVTIESGAMKILSTRMLDVVDYREVSLSTQLYAGGVVVDAGTISRHLAAALADMKGAHRSLYAAVPGYQSAMRRFDLPDVREIDPKEVIPREARRVLGFPVENAALRWQRLPGRSRIARWLVAASSDASFSSISAVVKGTGHKMRALELRPFALTRAVGHPTVVCVFVSSDGCDVVIVRDWEPHTYQSVYWETGSVSDTGDLVRRLTEVVENTVDLHNLHNPEVSLTPNVPITVTGGETDHHANLGIMVAASAGRDLVFGKNPLNAPGDFPYQSLVVNVGLALYDI